MNEQAKRDLLRQLPHGCLVVGVRDGDTMLGFTATWITQCSFKPPLVVLAVKADSRAFSILEAGRVFSLSFLDRSQQEVAQAFFKAPEVSTEGWAGYPVRFAASTVPVLDDCLGYLDCRVDHIVPIGDHHLVIGEVVEAEVLREGTLLLLSETPWSYGG